MENITHLSETNEQIESITQSLRQLPDEVFLRLQYFQPEAGCFNACAFCSQEAGTEIWQLDKKSLENLIKAIGIILDERKIKLAGGREHRTGVVFPYLDNDCFSYPYLYEYLKGISEKLHSKIRVATVGYSRHNTQLQEMHEKIVKNCTDSFSGIRFSITPFTRGWVHENSTDFSREEYEKDMANTIQTYVPLIQKLGIHKNTACCELRFMPHIQKSEVVDEIKNNKHIISYNNFTLISEENYSDIQDIYDDIMLGVNNNIPKYQHPERKYQMFLGNQNIGTVGVRKLKNIDGIYYAVNSDFQDDGKFEAIHIYPKTESRNISGYNNATRFLLNAILEYKKQHNIQRREQFENATWEDIDNILQILHIKNHEYQDIDASISEHIQKNIIPLVESYIKILKNANLPPSLFFHPAFTIDTGQIVNQGRAKKLFKGLISMEDSPFTPREMRAYGHENSISAERGKTWRLVPVVNSHNELLNKTQIGGKSIINHQFPHSVAIHEVTEHSLRNKDYNTGEELQHYYIQGVNLERRKNQNAKSDFLLPGVKNKIINIVNE